MLRRVLIADDKQEGGLCRLRDRRIHDVQVAYDRLAALAVVQGIRARTFLLDLGLRASMVSKSRRTSHFR